MEQKNKNNIWVWVVVGVIVVGGGVYLALTGGVPSDVQPSGQEEEVVQEQQEFSETTGVSPISEEGVVLNAQGEEARNDVTPSSPEAPQQSNPITDESQIPASAIKINVSAEGFNPSSFTVRAGEPVTLSVTSIDTQTHVFAFKDPSLQAVAVGVGPGETRAITFNAPSSSGEYAFFCNVPGHEGRGEAGVMIVQ